MKPIHYLIHFAFFGPVLLFAATSGASKNTRTPFRLESKKFLVPPSLLLNAEPTSPPLPFSTLSADEFPYFVTFVDDGPTVYDTPMTVNLTLTPKYANVSATPKYYFNWVDPGGPFDCPHRIVKTFSLSPLFAVYNATYHYQYLRCPPLSRTDGRRTIGVEIYDYPDFDPAFSRPVAAFQTTVKLMEHPEIWMAVREIKFEEPWYYEGTYHLRERIFGLSTMEKDPWQVMRWANATRFWSISDYYIPHANFGRIFMHVFNRTGFFDITVNTTLYMDMPRYPGMKGPNRTMIKTGYNTTRIKFIESVHDLKILDVGNKTTPAERPWDVRIYVNGSFPLTVNWTISYINHDHSSDVPLPFRDTFTCEIHYPPHLDPLPDEYEDLSSHVCVVPITHNFTRPGGYRIFVSAANRLSEQNITMELWVYAAHPIVLNNTLVFPVVFSALAVGCLIFLLANFERIQRCRRRRIEVADFQVSFSYNSQATSRRSWFRGWLPNGLGEGPYASWFRSLTDLGRSEAHSKRDQGGVSDGRYQALPGNDEDDVGNVIVVDKHAMAKLVENLSYTELKERAGLAVHYDGAFDRGGAGRVVDGELGESDEEEVNTQFLHGNSYQNSSGRV